MIGVYRARKRSVGSRTSILMGRVRYFSMMVGVVFDSSSAQAWDRPVLRLYASFSCPKLNDSRGVGLFRK